MVIATPPISALTVSSVVKNDPTRFSSAMRGPRRSRIRSNTGRPDTATTRPDMSA